MPSGEVVRLGVSTSTRDDLRRLSQCFALCFVDAIDDAVRVDCVERVYNARSAWTANFGGEQFTLGRAYYTHLEEGREEEYFSNAAASDAAVHLAVPGLAERLMGLVAGLTDGPVAPRHGWCGPGVHIFPAGGEVARRGGEVHFDTEGLHPSQIARRAPALTFVLMLQRPELGGGLRLWGRTFDGDDRPQKPRPSEPVARVEYEHGDLVVIDSYRLHQILPFRGETDRITATAHAVFENGTWEVWF